MKKEKSLIVEHNFFCKIVPYWMCLDQGEDFKLTTELSKKVQYYRNQAIKNGLNEVILGYLKDSNAATHSVDNDIFYLVIDLSTRSKSYIITFIS